LRHSSKLSKLAAEIWQKYAKQNSLLQRCSHFT